MGRSIICAIIVVACRRKLQETVDLERLVQQVVLRSTDWESLRAISQTLSHAAEVSIKWSALPAV
jgi:hypothetical protein